MRQDIKNIITAKFLAVASTLTDSQISNMSTNSFQTIPAWLPLNRSPQLIMPPNVDQATFIQTAQQIRNGNSTAVAAATAQIASEVDEICNIMAYALPSDWNVTYYSPYRVFCIAYYLASNDDLAYSYTDCQTRMTNVQNWLSAQGFNAPCTGRVLWGDAGYLYTRPTSIFFSDAVQLDLLNRYAAVHGLA
jgi:hypothetical protein